jgi:predicted RNA-binding protein
VKSHGGLLMAEDGVEGVVCLDVMGNSKEPLSIVVIDLDKFLPTFEVESSQEFAVAPIIG